MSKDIIVAVVTAALTIVGSVTIAFVTDLWIPLLKTQAAQKIIEEQASKAADKKIKAELKKVKTTYMLFEPIATKSLKKQSLGDWQICTLVTAGESHYDQACQCIIENIGKKDAVDWQLRVNLDPSVDGICNCRAACFNFYLPEETPS